MLRGQVMAQGDDVFFDVTSARPSSQQIAASFGTLESYELAETSTTIFATLRVRDDITGSEELYYVAQNFSVNGFPVICPKQLLAMYRHAGAAGLCPILPSPIHLGKTRIAILYWNAPTRFRGIQRFTDAIWTAANAMPSATAPSNP
jgi:hypothetical protein